MSDTSRSQTTAPRPAAFIPVLGGAALVAGAAWWACLHLLHPLQGMETPLARILFSLKCLAVAALLTLLTMIEAAAHERLVSKAFDPLAGKDSHRLQVNLRVLQNTLEQFALFAPGLLVLAIYCDDGRAMRAVVAATLVWIVARYVFWIGYHRGPQHRIAGLIGTLQTMLVLLYVSARFGYELAGLWGATVPLMLFALVELVIVSGLRRQ